MGIKNLSKILQAKCKGAISTRPFSAYMGSRFAIDTSIVLYKSLYVYGDVVEGLLRQAVALLRAGILPVYVLDGKPPKEKAEVLKERRERREELVATAKVLKRAARAKEAGESDLHGLLDRYMEEDLKKTVEERAKIAGSEEWRMAVGAETGADALEREAEKVEKKVIYVRGEHIASAKRLFDLMGVPYITSQCEAETLCAFMSKRGIVDGVISEDSDVLASGGTLLLKNISLEKGTVTEVCLQGVLTEMGMTYDQFLDVCILCGCDYTSKIHGVGPMHAVKLIHKYQDLERAMEHIRGNPSFQVPADFDYVTSRRLFKEACAGEDFEAMREQVLQRPMQMTGLLAFLQEKCPRLRGRILTEIRELGNEFKNERAGFAQSVHSETRRNGDDSKNEVYSRSDSGASGNNPRSEADSTSGESKNEASTERPSAKKAVAPPKKKKQSSIFDFVQQQKETIFSN